MATDKKIYLSENASRLFDNIDYGDTFTTTNHINSIEEICYLIFGKSPKWLISLMELRNTIAKRFNLKTEVPEDAKQEFKVGGYIKFFKIYGIYENEIILGADDSHLNFRVVLSKTPDEIDNVKCTTLVKYNNKLGKYYMNIIKIGHKLIVNHLVKQAYRPDQQKRQNEMRIIFL